MKVKYFTIPNVLTLCNLLCGIMAMLSTVTRIRHLDSDGGVGLAMPLFFLLGAAIFDYLDGAAARLLKQYSPLGVQLDSLADMVSFGIVPSMLLCVMYIKASYTDAGLWGAITFSVALCSALRLARFNIDDSQKTSFEGLATPACALLVASLAYWFTVDFGHVPLSRLQIAVISLLLSWLLISPIRMFSLKFSDFSFKGINIVRYIFLLISLAVLVIGGFKWLWCIIIVYILSSLIMWLSAKCANN